MAIADLAELLETRYRPSLLHLRLMEAVMYVLADED